MRPPSINRDPTVTVITNQRDLDAAFEIRRQVFVREQGFELADEFDADDSRAIHLLASIAGEPIATARIVPDGDSARIGRVAVLPDYRGSGYGLAIMAACERIAARRGFKSATLHSQIQVQSFYERAGYAAKGEVFDECGWPHITMQKPLNQPVTH